MKETLIVDDTDAYIQAGIQGVGLIRVASYLVAPYLQSGALVLCMENLSLIYRFRWSIRKTAIFLRRYAPFMTGAERCCTNTATED